MRYPRLGGGTTADAENLTSHFRSVINLANTLLQSNRNDLILKLQPGDELIDIIEAGRVLIDVCIE
jgi:hypothetical protein